MTRCEPRNSHFLFTGTYNLLLYLSPADDTSLGASFADARWPPSAAAYYYDFARGAEAMRCCATGRERGRRGAGLMLHCLR